MSTATHYRVSGGPMTITSHLYTSLSSTRPAENPSTGFLFSSTKIRVKCFERKQIYQ